MINTEDFINELYWFLQENRYIDKTPNAYRKEMFLLKKLENLHDNSSLSDSNYNDLNKLCLDAIFENEISGFISGIYFSKIINTLL